VLGRGQSSAGSVVVTGFAKWEMRLRIESYAHQFFLYMRVPVVLYLVVRPPGQNPCNKRPFVAEAGVEFDD